MPMTLKTSANLMHTMAMVIALLASTLTLAPKAVQAETNQPTLKLPKSSTFAGNYLAGLYAADNLDPEAGVLYLKRALEEDPFNSDLIRQIVFLELMRGHFDGARPFAVSMVENKMSGRNLAQLFLAIDDFASNRAAAATKALDVLIESATEQGNGDAFTSFASNLFKSWSLQAEGQHRKAVRNLESIETIPAFGFIQKFHIALLLDLEGKHNEAKLAYEAALNENQLSSRLIDAYARFLAKIGDANQALDLIAEFRTRNNQFLSSSLQNLQADLENGADVDLAVNSPSQGLTEALYNLGLFINSQGSDDLSIVLYRFALHVSPSYDMAEFALANTFKQLNQFDISIDLYSNIQIESHLWRSSQIEIANNWRLLEKPEEARNTLTSLLARDGKDLQVLIAMGNLLRSQEKYIEAAEFYSTAIDVIASPQPKDWRIFYYRGIAYERAKQWSKAEVDFQKSLELNPDEPDVLNYLGYSWVDQNLNLEPALAMIRKAVELDPRNGYIVDSLGWAYYKLGRFEEATIELEKAVTLRPGDPILNDHLGDSFWMIGRKREARFKWSHALTMNPTDKDKERIEKKLELGLDAILAQE